MKQGELDRTVWLMRHGESTWNVDGLVQGQADGPVLTPSGRQQAVDATVTLRRTSVSVAEFITSDLERARETAERMARALRTTPTPQRAVRERNLGIAQGRPVAELRPNWSGIDGGRVVDPLARPPDGESLAELDARARSFLSALASREYGGDVVVVTHGGVIRMALAQRERIPLEGMAWAHVPNGSLWPFRLDELIATSHTNNEQGGEIHAANCP